ncbi:MAG: glycosyltransferase, partial [Candidatus Nanopelagicales bacterium]
MTEQPAICLNMIVRNEAHVIHELLDSVAPLIHSWVIVDTGSEDGTQDKIRDQMASLGIPGELYERPWRNFGHNRSEALELAQGHADYIWVMDADDLLVGTVDFTELNADACQMRIESPGVTYWRRQIFRDGVPWRYEGVVHEYAVCDVPHSEQRLDGQYSVQSRRIGGRNLDPNKYRRDIDLLLAEVERNPDDTRSVFYIARSYNSLADWVNARDWYMRRAAMGGWEEEIFYSLWRTATAMHMLGEPWPQVQEAYLRAWEYRPSRAEPLHDIAVHYRENGRYVLGHLFAQRAAQIPCPPE